MRQVELIALTELEISRYRQLLACQLRRYPGIGFNHIIRKVVLEGKNQVNENEEVNSSEIIMSFPLNVLVDYPDRYDRNDQIEKQIKNSQLMRQRHIEQLLRCKVEEKSQLLKSIAKQAMS